MSKRVPALQPLAWQLHSDLPDEMRYVPVLRMPTAVREGLRSLSHFSDNIPPVTSLYNALTAFAPEILAFAPINQVFGTDLMPDWMYVYPDRFPSIQIDRLKVFIRIWLAAWIGGAEAQRQTEVWFKSPSWSWGQIDLAIAPFELKRRLLPALIARYLLTKEFQFCLQDKSGAEFQFDALLSPQMDSQLTAQLVSTLGTRRDHQYSFVLKLSLGQLPPDNGEVLIQRLVVRRWIHEPMLSESGYVDGAWRRGISVFWRRSSGYLSDMPSTEVYTRLTFKQFGKGTEHLHWLGQQEKVQSSLNFTEPLPAIAELVRAPHAYQPDLLIMRSQRHHARHFVEPGVWSNDHRLMYEVITPLIAELAAPSSIVNRSEPKGASKVYFDLSKVPTTDRFEALKRLPQGVRIELYLDDIALAKRIILTEIGITDSVEERVKAEPLCVTYGNRLLLEVMGGTMRLTDPLSSTTWKEYEREKRKRKQEIQRELKAVDIPTGALVKLTDYRKGKKFADPKEAIRFGLLDSERVARFLTPDEKGYEHRLQNAIRSLLRILGYRLMPFYQKPVNSSLPEHLDIYAPWIIQLNAKDRSQNTVLLPVVSHIVDGNTLHLLLPSSTGSPVRYTSLYEGILGAERSSREFAESEQKSILNFFRRVLEDRRQDADSLLLLWESNVRRIFQTDNFTSELLPDGCGKMRVARMRYSTDTAVPMCVPVSPFSKYHGLFRKSDNEPIFYSLHNIGKRPVLKDARKLSSLSKQAINPASCLIWLSDLLTSDDSQEWAWLIHNLRTASTHTDVSTELPQPLHDLMLVNKFLSRHIEEVIDEEADADEG